MQVLLTDALGSPWSVLSISNPGWVMVLTPPVNLLHPLHLTGDAPAHQPSALRHLLLESLMIPGCCGEEPSPLHQCKKSLVFMLP